MKGEQNNQPTAEELSQGLIISVGEARKILGKECESMTDDEIISEIYNLTDAIQELFNTSFLTKSPL